MSRSPCKTLEVRRPLTAECFVDRAIRGFFKRQSNTSLHCADGNLTNTPREAMTITYVADGTRIDKPTNDNQRMDLEAFLPDQKPGELVGSRLNPVLLS